MYQMTVAMLLAKAAFRGQTHGYTRHPPLARFKAHTRPRPAINFYLAAVLAEATRPCVVALAARAGYPRYRRRPGPVASWERPTGGA